MHQVWGSNQGLRDNLVTYLNWAQFGSRIIDSIKNSIHTKKRIASISQISYHIPLNNTGNLDLW